MLPRVGLRRLSLYAISLHVFRYNFISVHQTIRRTPAMAAGITDRVWPMDDVVELIESQECEAAQTRALALLG